MEWIRIHRTYIVKISCIEEIIRNDDGVVVKLKSDQTLPVARRRVNELLAKVNAVSI